MNLTQAVLDLSQEIPIDNNGVKARLDRAYDIVRMPGYELRQAGTTWVVEKLSTSVLGVDAMTYTVTDGQCTCPDGATAYGGLCKHVLATRLLEMMAVD